MGLLGLRKFIDSGCSSRFLPNPLDEDNELAQPACVKCDGERLNRSTKRSLVDLEKCEATPMPSAVLPRGRGGNGKVSVLTSSSSSSFASPSSLDATAGAAASQGVPCVDHVLIDMNCIVHSCLSRAKGLDKREVIQSILGRLQGLLTQVVTPRRSLTFCLDGPAPYAKLQTQRLRRRKVALMDATADQLTSLSVTAGSLFLVELENALAAQFKLNDGKGFLKSFCPTFLFGSTVIGEGEAKISRALAFLASSSDRVYRMGGDYDAAVPFEASSGGRPAGAPVNAPPYNVDDTVIVIGNDIDLVLTCVAATPYHNLGVLHPSSLQLLDLSDWMFRWVRVGGPGEAMGLPAAQLPSARIDFTFLFLLNGGDHYAGAGEVAAGLWQRYRQLRSACPEKALISAGLNAVSVGFLAEVLQAETYDGAVDPTRGMALLQAALWALFTTVTGVCPDYAFVPEESLAGMGATLTHLRAAVARCRRQARRVVRLTGAEKQPSQPLTPLATLIALMPTEAALPASVQRALREPSARDLTTHLLSSNDPAEVARLARRIVKLAGPHLTRSEGFLDGFTGPVRLNARPPPPRRLSRHEQHRLLARGGRSRRFSSMAAPENPVAEVRPIAPPPPSALPYTTWLADFGDDPNAPSPIHSLSFYMPFDSASGSSISSALTSFEDGTNAGSKKVSEKGLTQRRRVVPLHEAAGEATTALLAQSESRLEEACRTVATLRGHQLKGRLRREATLRAAKRRLQRLQLESNRHIREAVRVNDAQFQLERPKGPAAEALREELKGFLGEHADNAVVRSLLEGKGKAKASKRARKARRLE